MSAEAAAEDFAQRLIALYAKPDDQDTERDLNFHAELANDLDDFNVWFNACEMAAYHDIDGVKVLCLLVNDKRGAALNIILPDVKEPEGIIKSRAVLFIRAQEIEGVKAGQSMSIDGRLYLVTGCNLLQNQVWRIELEANNSYDSY